MCCPPTEPFLRRNALVGIIGTVLGFQILWVLLVILNLCTSTDQERSLLHPEYLIEFVLLVIFFVFPFIELIITSVGLHGSLNSHPYCLKGYTISKIVFYLIEISGTLFLWVPLFVSSGPPPSDSEGLSYVVVYYICRLVMFILSVISMVFAFQAAQDILQKSDQNASVEQSDYAMIPLENLTVQEQEPHLQTQNAVEI